MQYNYGYKSREYLTGRPHLTVLKDKGKSLKASSANTSGGAASRGGGDDGSHGDDHDEDEQCQNVS